MGDAQNQSCLSSSLKFLQWVMFVECLETLVNCVLSGPKSVQLCTRRFKSNSLFLPLTSFMEIQISCSSLCDQQTALT